MRPYLALLLAFASPALAGNPESAAYSARGYHEVLLRCPDRIWPGVGWTDLQFLFSDPESKDAWLVSNDSLNAEVVRKDQTIEDIFQAGFEVGMLEFRGRRTVAVNTEGRSPEVTFRLAVHHLFRDVGQGEWDNPYFDNRGTLYPLLPEPRYFRRMAFEALKSALLATGEHGSPKDSLSAASYWLQRWRRAYPEELPMRTDTLTGTALYSEQLSYLFAVEGCGVRGDAFHAAFRQHLEPELLLFADDLLPEEGMALGALSSYLLTYTQPGWFAKMDGRMMTTDLVVEGALPVPQPDDEKLRSTYQLIVQGQQKQAAKLVTPVFVREKDKAYARISIPAQWLKGELAVGSSYVLRDRLDTTLLFLSDKQDFEGEKGKVTIASQGALVQSDRNGCGGVFHFMMPLKNVAQNGKKFTGQQWWTKFELEGERKVVNGFTWICPRE